MEGGGGGDMEGSELFQRFIYLCDLPKSVASRADTTPYILVFFCVCLRVRLHVYTFA